MDGKMRYPMCIDTQKLVYQLSYRMTGTGHSGISHTGFQSYSFNDTVSIVVLLMGVLESTVVNENKR